MLIKSVQIPTCIFIRRGRYYLYNGDYNHESLKDFALGTYEQSAVQGTVPGESTVLKKVWRGIIDLIETYSVYVNDVLMLDQATGQVNYLTCLFAFGIPLALVILTIRFAFKQEDD